MNSNGKLVDALRVGVTPELKQSLRVLARRNHRSLSSMVRVLLEEAIELENTLRPQSSTRKEFEITLNIRQAARLIKQGYDLQVWEPQYSQRTLL